MEHSDIVVISGGSSQGKKDETNSVIDELASEGAFTHGLALKPGKPTILGYDRPTQTLLAGLPGHPAAAMLVFRLVIGWLWRASTGEMEPYPRTAAISTNLPAAPGKLTCQLVHLARLEDGSLSAIPIFGRSGLISTLSGADGYILIEENKEGLKRESGYLYTRFEGGAMGKRNLYLKTIPVEEAQALYQDALKAIAVRRTEKIPVEESLGRMTAKAIYARCCSPLFNAAAMDGIAVIAKETAGATQENPLTLVRGKDYQIVDTGDPVHPPYDAVIMAEDLLEAEEDVVQIMEAASGWQHVRPIGEDIVAGEMLLPGSHKIRPIDIGVLLSGGILEVEVIKRPRVGLILRGRRS